MRFNVTALGTDQAMTPDEVARRIVEYLVPPKPKADPEIPVTSLAASGATRYYADRGEEPGQWLGAAAEEAGLTGEVDPIDFARVLAGRDPATGARLITAQGSAGRTPTLGVGTATRRGADGQWLYALHDAAAALELPDEEVGSMVADGELVAFSRLLGALDGEDLPLHDPDPATYLVPVIEDDGTRWVCDAELSRCETERARRDPAVTVEEAGEPEDLLSIPEAARLSGLSPRYLRSLCVRYEGEGEAIETALAQRRTPKRAYLIGQRVGRKWQVSRGELVAFLRRRRPPAVRVGFDVTLTTEKSLGVLALLGDDNTRRAVLEAIRSANRVGIDHFQEIAAWARANERRVGTRGFMVASFQHLTSRALDPFPHHHNVMPNTVVDEHGTRRAIDARGLYWYATEASALATARVRYELDRDLKVWWRRAPHGGWEIDGIGDDVCREFSQRTNDMEAAVREMEAAIGRGTTIEELRAIARSTRPPKQDVAVAELTASWWRRARKHGLTPKKLGAVINRPSPGRFVPEADWIFAQLASPDGLCADGSVFTRADVLHALVDLPVPTEDGPQPLILPPAEFVRLADDFLASRYTVELIPSESRDAPVPAYLRHLGMFTTPEMLAVQRCILHQYEAGLSRSFGTVRPDVLEGALDRHPRLTPEQRGLVRAFCTSGHRLQCGIGRAGAGKTTTMRAAVAAWQAAGYEVRGAAVKGEAARILGTATGVPSETLAWYLVQDDPDRTPFHERTVLIVDEASTVSDRDLDKLLHIAIETGATLRLIGDPAQHGAVGAGGMFRMLCEASPGHTPELAQSHRLRHPGDLSAADALRDGRIEEALGHLAASGHLHIVESESDLYVQLLRQWWADRHAGTPHPMVDRRNSTRLLLNRLAHRLLQAAGEVADDEIEASGGRAFAVGDQVVARVTDRTLHIPKDPSAYVRNGATGKVVRLRRGAKRSGDQLVVAFEGIGVIPLPRRFFDERPRRGGRDDAGVDHAYAVTSYAVQGADFGVSASRIDHHTSRSEAYVDLTRGQLANHLYLTRGRDPLDGEHLPRLPGPPIDEAVQSRLEASGPERTAVEIDPLAETADGTDLWTLRTRREALDQAGEDGAALRRAETVRRRFLARQAEQLAGPAMLAAFPDRPTVPYLLTRWRRDLARVLAYRERWQPATGQGSWNWALGAPSDHPGQGAERDEVAEALGQLVVASVTEALRGEGFDAVPPWARPHLLDLARRGVCRPDTARLGQLYRTVAAYREVVGLAEPSDADADGESILGPPPTERRFAAMHRGSVLQLEAMANAPGPGQLGLPPT